MSFTPCRGITQNITNNCQPRIKGFEQIGGIVNKKDVEYFEIVDGCITTYSFFNGFPIYQLRQNPKPFNSYKVEFQPDTNLYKKTIQFYFDGIGAENAKNVIDSLKDNESMIIIERKEKLNDNNTYIFIGAQNGLYVTEMVEDEETGYWLVTMECEEPAGEISFTNFQMEGFVNGERIEL
jgi:hypothetical protein